MNLFFTTNMQTIDPTLVAESEKVTSITMQSYAGQTDKTQFRIGNPSTGDEALLIYSTDPNITISLNEVRGFAPALNLTVEAETVGSTIHVSLSAPLDPTEGDRTGHIIAGNEILSVNYFLASTKEADTDKPPIERFPGTETFNILEQFENEGEAVIIYRYDPITKPIGEPTGAVSTALFESLNCPAEFCNRNNFIVGYRLVGNYPTKAFVGDEQLDQNTLHDFITGGLTYSNTSRLLLPPNFEGFNPKPLHTRVLFAMGITVQTPAFQHTQFTIKRNDGEYALLNIRQQSYFKGQFLYYSCDLARINYPGGSDDVGFLPWNQLYDEHGKIVAYIKSWSDIDRSDPYLNDPYVSNAAKLGFQTLAFVDNAIVFQTWTGE